MKRKLCSGTTLLEMIITVTILLILMGATVPVARIRIKREKETELRRDLWELRSAIDHYRDAADRGLFHVKVGSDGYPPDLETLVNGIETPAGKRLRFLRRIPVDPFTGSRDWGLHSMQDEPQSESWGGQNVFDVYTKTSGSALDGSKYRDW